MAGAVVLRSCELTNGRWQRFAGCIVEVVNIRQVRRQ